MGTTLSLVLLIAYARGFTLAPCDPSTQEQRWVLSPGVQPGDSATTIVKMAGGARGCWEVTGCAEGDGAAVGCGYGCKPLPNAGCSSKCDCNGAWSSHPNGTITMVMDGKCLTAPARDRAPVVSTCTTGTVGASQRFEWRPLVAAAVPTVYHVVAVNGECVQGAKAPPPPPPPCTSIKNKTRCEVAKDKGNHARCYWNNTTNKCNNLPPPPPPQACANITIAADCRWSNSPSLPKGRDCRWNASTGTCGPAPPLPPLPQCALDHTCAHNGRSEKPPMGWRSWNLFAQHNDDTTMRAMMNAMVDKSRLVGGKPMSLAEVGYTSVGMDDGFQRCNCSTPQGPYPHSLTNVTCSVNDCRGGGCTWHNQTDGTPMIDTLRFPNLAELVKYGHALSLQVGFYLNTCICMEKGRTYFEQDVAFLAEMEFDTVKIDQCGSAMNMSLWAALINATGRPMMLENCHNSPSWWSPGADAAKICDSNMWRSGGDIGNGFGGALSEAHQWFAKNNISSTHPWGAVPISRPGCWGYPDMMEIGNFCKDPPGQNKQCEDEERAHMGLWCIVSSPLILGFNMSNKDDMDRVWPTITNSEAIAVDHAWAGLPGGLHKTLRNGTVELWYKPLPNKEVAVLILNTGTSNVTADVVVAEDIPCRPNAASYRSIWDKQDVPIQDGRLSIALSAHDNVFAIFSGCEGHQHVGTVQGDDT